MSMRHMVKVRGGAAVVVAAVLTLVLAGCGGDGEKSKEPTASQSQGDKDTPQPVASNGKQTAAPAEILATMEGEPGMTLTINSARRDAGGFLTVAGQFKNSGAVDYVNTTAWRGNELTDSGTSVAGVTLVDKTGKKRYYVLRDTDGRCLCTTGVSTVAAGETMPFFAQFPAPPASTTEVEFSLPTFATATVKLSG
ncbi:hypothetical protein ABZY44_18900 [Streptomyces sp. NPDC006544]|uniref:hypothetical protein n=1 Tax=Streptomyces sp. NPDC006544 TaxID=3154583 RepID=UPI0033A12998